MDKGSSEEAALLGSAALLAGAQAGDEAVREELFRRYGPPLDRFLTGRLASNARSLLETQDLVQEVWIRVLKSLDRIEHRGVGSIWHFVRSVALNYLRDVYRRRGIGDRTEPLPEESSVAPPFRGPDAGARLEGKEWFEVYERALENVQPRQRDALHLRQELGLSYDSIAQECGFPSPDAARVAIRRTLATIYEEMARHAGGEGSD